jgi:hypothetical protein
VEKKGKKKAGTKAIYADVPEDLHAAFIAEVDRRGMKVHRAVEFALQLWISRRGFPRPLGKARKGAAQ